MVLLRRNLLAKALPLVLTGLAYTPHSRAQGAAASTVDTTPDEWMQDYLRRSGSSQDADKRIFGAFQLQRFPGGMYALLSPVRWAPQGQQQGSPVEVPRLFVCDLASVPRPFWSLFPRDGDYAYAAVLHDYLYWAQDRPRAHADKIFRYAMDDLRIKDSQAAVLFRAVDLAGEAAWRANAEMKLKGERRILKRLPDDPTISWEEWKKRPDVF